MARMSYLLRQRQCHKYCLLEATKNLRVREEPYKKSVTGIYVYPTKTHEKRADRSSQAEAPPGRPKLSY